MTCCHTSLLKVRLLFTKFTYIDLLFVDFIGAIIKSKMKAHPELQQTKKASVRDKMSAPWKSSHSHWSNCKPHKKCDEKILNLNELR